jgi:DNA polymerase-3 subunit delta
LILEADAILKQVQQRQFQPVYFLQGDEPYFIDTVADAL